MRFKDIHKIKSGMVRQTVNGKMKHIIFNPHNKCSIKQICFSSFDRAYNNSLESFDMISVY